MKYAVVGMGYGDEGKGLITDYLAHKLNNSVVIRSSGASQGGHTVVTPDGKRHIFSQLGSGSFVPDAKYIMDNVMYNPITFKAECEDFINIAGKLPEIQHYRLFRCTTYADIIANHRDSVILGHGSTGMGIFKTLKRGREISSDINYFNMSNNDIQHLLNRIEKYYLDADPNFFGGYDTILLREMFMDGIKYMRDVTSERYLYGVQNSIYEGTQGIELSELSSNAPHLTPLPVISNGYYYDEMIFVTRTYKTKHGAGNFREYWNEVDEHFNIVDETNIPNDFQGSLRTGILDVNKMVDLAARFTDNSESTSVAITCVDQMKHDKIPVKEQRGIRFISLEELMALIRKRFSSAHYINVNKFYISRGPTREDVEVVTI